MIQTISIVDKKFLREIEEYMVNPKAKKLGIENSGDIYAVLLDVASKNFELNSENCKTTYLLDYVRDSDWDIDNGKEITVSQMKNPENEEDIIECWGTLDDFSEE